MKPKIRVYGKSQSRTALGIINAYLILYPDTTLEELQAAFPAWINPKSFTNHLMVPQEEAKAFGVLFFEKDDEQIVLKSGQKLSLIELWTKENYEAIYMHARQYGIDAIEEENRPFEKGNYEIEIIENVLVNETTTVPAGVKIEQKIEVNNSENLVARNEMRKIDEVSEIERVIEVKTPVPPQPPREMPKPLPPNDKKKNYSWIWWLIVVVLIILLVFLARWCSKNESPEPPKDISIETTASPKGYWNKNTNAFIYDFGTVTAIVLPNGKTLNIGDNSSEKKLLDFLMNPNKKVESDDRKGWMTLDRTYFALEKAELTDDSKKQLENIYEILTCFPEAHIIVSGHTDELGTKDYNLQLSAERAKVTAQRLKKDGLEPTREDYVGFGEQFPVCTRDQSPECRSLNRRIDIKVTKK